jgi:HPr kinase/phosphorylase
MERRTALIHATAFLFGEAGILVTGASGAGKSRLVLELAALRPAEPVRLVADDRVRVSPAGGRLVARPAASFLGMIEVRGIGMAEMGAMPSAVIRCVVKLQSEEPPRMPDGFPQAVEIEGISLPAMPLMLGDGMTSRFLSHWPFLRGRLWGA